MQDPFTIAASGGGLVIDVHCHLFNVDDIPLKGFLLARGVPRRIAELIEKMIQDMTPEDRLAAGREEGLSEEHIVTIAQRVLSGNFSRRTQFLFPKRKRLRKPPRSLDLKTVLPKGQIRWLRILTLPSVLIAKRLIETFPETHLFVPLLIDMKYWIQNGTERPFIHQIKEMERIIVQYPGRFHPFVAFDPERERRYRGQAQGSLNLVRQAVFSQGFIGVKLYPPLGFLPTNNASSLSYSSNGQAYDEILADLYAFCEKEGIPITAHCTRRGARTHPRSGRLADPRYWEPVLEAYPKLRINFAHFGGDKELLKNGKRSWSLKIVELMQRFDHVYADTGYHKRIYRTRTQDKLFHRLEALCQQFPRLFDRLMFGSDWHLLALKRRSDEYYEMYTHLYEQHFGSDATRLLSGINALRFLGLVPGAKNHGRLIEYYRKQDLPLPPWLMS